MGCATAVAISDDAAFGVPSFDRDIAAQAHHSRVALRQLRVETTRVSQYDTAFLGRLTLHAEMLELSIQGFSLDSQDSRSGRLVALDRLEHVQNIAALDLFHT